MTSFDTAGQQGISIGPPKVELGEGAVLGNLMWWSGRCFRSHAGRLFVVAVGNRKEGAS